MFLLQSNVPGFVGLTRTNFPFFTCVITMHCGALWPPTSVGPMSPPAVNAWVSFRVFSSDSRVSVPPLAVAFVAASVNRSAAM